MRIVSLSRITEKITLVFAIARSRSARLFDNCDRLPTKMEFPHYFTRTYTNSLADSKKRRSFRTRAR